MALPHPELLAVGAALGVVGALACRRLPEAAAPWATALLPLVGLLVGPGMALAIDSWERPPVVVGAVVGIGLAVAATAGASAVDPLGRAGTWAALTAAAAAAVLAVPDTEGPVLTAATCAGISAVLLWRPRERTAADGEGPTAVAGAAIALVALSGATGGIAAAIGAIGCVAVLLAAGPLGRRPGPRPVVAWWAATGVVAVGAAMVARLGAVRSTSARALIVTVAAVAGAWLALEAAARLTSGRARPSP